MIVMMERIAFAPWMPFDNILYIGDEAKTCLAAIEKFNGRLLEIEKLYSGWFSERKGRFMMNDKLQHHIYYHFEGGIAMFKFRNDDRLPAHIRTECFKACRNIAAEQLFSAA
jgi:hypothetical protein